MAETSIQNAGRAIATADRYQVNVSIDTSELTPSDPKIPPKRPTLFGVGPIAMETAKRIACDCSITNVGRKTRLWPNAMARIIKERDQHCAWPGCTHSRHLHIHHIKHWADGGETSVHNGVCLCSYHHTQVHEGGYTIEHVDGNTLRLDEQYAQQQQSNNNTLFEFESALRNDRESFNTVRKLSPTRFRYRVLDTKGQIVSGCSVDSTASFRQCVEAAEYTRVYSNSAIKDTINEAPSTYKVCRSHRKKAA